VAGRRPESTRKKRTREHVIADLSVNHVERFILRCGFSVERVFHDYGLDLYMSTYDSAGEAENGMVLFQLKATDHLKLRADGEALLLRIERTDLDWWLAETLPVILVAYDAQADIAYALYVQAHFAGKQSTGRTTGRTVIVQIPTRNVLTEDAVRRFAAAKARVLLQMKGVSHHEE